MQLKPSFGVGNRNQGPIMDGYLSQNFLFRNSYTKSKSCGNEHMKENVFIFQFQQNNKIFKRGFNVNAQEWKPSSRRTSVGNASVKDIPMLDVFLQRLDQRHTNYNSDQASPTSNEQ